MKVLVTSSTGLTGKAVVKALASHGVSVRAMVHSDSHSAEMIALGARETTVASIESEEDLTRAMAGMDAVFYICPTAHPREGEIGCMAIDIAQSLGIRRFVYQSVHNVIEPELIHHRKKLMVEQHLLESKLNFTILRPTAFMQNILQNVALIKEKQIFAQRFFVSTDATNRINLIDVNDYAAIAAKVTAGSGYDYGCFDLCGPDNLSVLDMLDVFRSTIGKDVVLKYITDDEFIAMAQERHMPENTLNTLLAMFRAYNRYGFKGNDFDSAALLGHAPGDFRTFIKENL